MGGWVLVTDYWLLDTVSWVHFSEGNDADVSSRESAFSVACSRRPAEGFGTAHVGTPSLGKRTRCKISHAATKSRMVSQSGIGYATSSTPHWIIRMSFLQASQ
jgi:hypothetical protein